MSQPWDTIYEKKHSWFYYKRKRIFGRIRNIRPIWRVRMLLERASKGVCVEDTWSFDQYLARVIAQGTRHIAKYTHGYPAYPEDMTFEQWKDILNEIADSFEGYSFSKSPIYSIEEDQIRTENLQKGLSLLQKYYESIWD